MTWIVLGFTAAAAGFDLRSREIPDAVSASLLVVAAVAACGGLGSSTVLQACAGAGIAFAATLPFFWGDVLGGGDVKLLTAAGAALGGPLTCSVLVWTGLFGGLFGLAALVRGRRDLAFVPAIFAAVATVSVLNAGFSDVLLGR